jgi:hypothetical protein
MTTNNDLRANPRRTHCSLSIIDNYKRSYPCLNDSIESLYTKDEELDRWTQDRNSTATSKRSGAGYIEREGVCRGRETLPARPARMAPRL